VCGNPALSIPCGNSDDGMPVGLQLIGKAHQERTLYGIAETLEREIK
jgi:Asp-tRNA(Asn)/Glu-tRNA(Gln) amidotransferase A subunit family amidase